MMIINNKEIKKIIALVEWGANNKSDSLLQPLESFVVWLAQANKGKFVTEKICLPSKVCKINHFLLI